MGADRTRAAAATAAANVSCSPSHTSRQAARAKVDERRTLCLTAREVFRIGDVDGSGATPRRLHDAETAHLLTL